MRAEVALSMALLAGCGMAEPAPPGPAGCPEALAAYEASHSLPGADDEVVLSPSLVRGEDGGAPDPAVDGDRAAVGEGAVPQSLVVTFAEPVDVRGVVHWPPATGPAVTRFRVHLGDDTGCFDEAGTEVVVDIGPFSQETALPPRVASSVRFDILDSTDAGGEFRVADLELLVGAEFLNEPELVTPVETLWEWSAEARIPGVGPVAYELTVAPGGMTIDPSTGLVSWTPANAQFGEHEVVVVARRQAARLEKRFFLTAHP